MARITVSEAIRRSPVGRTQFYSKYVDEGLITVSVDNAGKKYIDTSELLRVFGELKGEQSADSSEQSETNSTEQPAKTTPEQSEVIRLLKEQLSELKHDVGERERFYQSQIVSLTSRLEGPAKQQNPIVRWWRGLG